MHQSEDDLLVMYEDPGQGAEKWKLAWEECKVDFDLQDFIVWDLLWRHWQSLHSNEAFVVVPLSMCFQSDVSAGCRIPY